ncbi:MAG: insulinase family protein, partial [Oscillospiraceae bacterium]|nr:insulinase family protein [Oscillospiraceae bacterium]
FAIYTALNPDTEREALSLIVSELDRFRSDGVTASEVDRVREQAKANLLMSLESTSSRASRLGRNELLLGYIPDMDSIIDAYDRVTADEIRELSREFIDFSRLSFSAVGRVGTADKYRELFENMRFD